MSKMMKGPMGSKLIINNDNILLKWKNHTAPYWQCVESGMVNNRHIPEKIMSWLEGEEVTETVEKVIYG